MSLFPESKTIPVWGVCQITFAAPGLRGPVERTVVFDMSKGVVTHPVEDKGTDVEIDCEVHVNRWFLDFDKEMLAAALRDVVWESAVLTDAASVSDS